MYNVAEQVVIERPAVTHMRRQVGVLKAVGVAAMASPASATPRCGGSARDCDLLYHQMALDGWARRVSATRT